VKENWGDGLCDVVRFYLLGELGMPLAAAQFFREICGKPVNDRYGEPAMRTLEYQEQCKLSFPEVLMALKAKDLNALLGNPTW
jgi:hypothetical protein